MGTGQFRWSSKNLRKFSESIQKPSENVFGSSSKSWEVVGLSSEIFRSVIINIGYLWTTSGKLPPTLKYLGGLSEAVNGLLTSEIFVVICTEFHFFCTVFPENCISLSQ